MVFKLSPTSPGQPWTETTIANLETRGEGIVQGRDGNLYGSTNAVSENGFIPGTLFQLAPSDGVWTENVIYTFNLRGTGGPLPPILDANLNIYLMTASEPYCGGVYKLTAMPGNKWEPSQLYVFNSRSGGCIPLAALTFGKWGVLYGTMSAGGPNSLNDGVVFAVEP